MKILTLVLTLGLFAVISKAQTLPPAFTTCPSAGFQVVNTPSEFQTVNLATGVTTTVATFPVQLNAMGFNPVDRRIYGIKQTPTPRAVIVIGSDYSYQLLPLSGAALPTSNIGDVNQLGILWCFGGGASPKVFTVNCNASAGTDFGKVTIIGDRPNVTTTDFSFPPDDNTRMYCVPTDGSLVYISTTDLSIHVVMPADITLAGAYGSTFFDGDGNFYAKNNTTGVIYKFANATTATPVVSEFSTSTASAQNDGARCANAPAAVIADYGDAPNSFGTFAATGGASHLLPSPNASLAKLYFGSAITIDGDGNPSTNANLDSDDGVSSFAPITASNPSIPVYNVTIAVSNTITPASLANVSGWIDWNNNLVFDVGEIASTSVAANFRGTATLTWNNVTVSAPDGTAGTYARFRISTDALTTPGGAAANGEVEDYYIPFDVALPVLLSSFTAVKSGLFVRVDWVTASEQNNKGFTIERGSNGTLFDQIGFVGSQAVAGSSTKDLKYYFYDTRPLAGVNYYRLKQTNLDDKVTYNAIAKVALNYAPNAISIYPNPASDKVVINGLKGNENIRLSTTTGQIIRRVRASGHTLTLDIRGITAGVYQLLVTDEAGRTVSENIVKK